MAAIATVTVESRALLEVACARACKHAYEKAEAEEEDDAGRARDK